MEMIDFGMQCLDFLRKQPSKFGTFLKLVLFLIKYFGFDICFGFSSFSRIILFDDVGAHHFRVARSTYENWI